MNKIVRIFAIIFFLYLVISLSLSIYSTYKTGDRVKEAENKLAGLISENERLKKRLAEVKTGQFIEKEAREKLGMSKPGETIVIMPSPGTAINDSTNPKVAKKELANWEKWKELFL